MKVKEYIEKLKEFPEDAEVMQHDLLYGDTPAGEPYFTDMMGEVWVS